METSSRDFDTLSTFEHGIEVGNLISGSDYIWCISSRDGELRIKNTKEKFEISSPYHDFGIASNDKYSVLYATDFEFNQQHYLLISLAVNYDKNLLALFQISISKVICSFEVPYKVIKIDTLVKNKDFISNSKNPSLLSNFDVTAVCGCFGGAIFLFDITPHEKMSTWKSDEYFQLKVSWFSGEDFSDYDEINEQKALAYKKSRIFGLTINQSSVGDGYFNYIMSNDQTTANLPSNYVKITALKYEKQIDSLMVGFNFGCFQIWNMKTLKIESSSGYGENTKPVVGFSLLQPQNDPKKCLYLLVAHSTIVETNKNTRFSNGTTASPLSSPSVSQDDSFKSAEESGLDNLSLDESVSDEKVKTKVCEDNDSEPSFVLLYNIMFERCINLFLNQYESYMLYENMLDCTIVFDHELTNSTLKSTKTNNLSDLNHIVSTKSLLEELRTNGLSKIISVQTINAIGRDNNQINLASIVWTIVDQYSSAIYYLTIFDLNNWYGEWMPNKVTLFSSEYDSHGRQINGRNTFLTSFVLPVKTDLNKIKLMTVVDSKIKSIFNRNKLSINNTLNELLESVEQNNINEGAVVETRRDLDHDSSLSMNFDIMVLTQYSLIKFTIRPIEQEINDIISKQEDLIYNPELIFNVLYRYSLIDNYLNKQDQTKFITVFDYLFDTSQIYVIIKSLWKLNSEDTSVISGNSLKVVLDWSWSKFGTIKQEINKLYELISIQTHNYLNNCYNQSQQIKHDHLTEFLQRENNQLENLIQIYKQFIKLNSSHEGHIELNKKLCLIECLKCYVEHLTLFHKFELLIPPEASGVKSEDARGHKNYIAEMKINFKLIRNRWVKRRQEQFERLDPNSKSDMSVNQKKYPFTYMIDCLIEECKLNSVVCKFLNKPTVNYAENQAEMKFFYPPKSIIDMLELCLEANLSTKIKQIIILYVLCDLMNTELAQNVQNHILKLINAYCSATFTIMSTSLDSTLSVPWSSSSTSILAISSDTENPNNSSCLFDLVNGLYLIDTRHIEKAHKYLRTAELSYLEAYEKYFILYNALSEKEYKMAIQYLWLFQKLNTSSITSMELTNPSSQQMANYQSNEQNVFKFFSVKNTCISGENTKNNMSCVQRNEQTMHLKAMLTIYLANGFVNEAYEFIKPHLKMMKQNTDINVTIASCVRQSKDVILHFFVETEKFKLIKKVCRVALSGQDLLHALVNYLEAKQDLNSIAIAINLHIDHRNYSRAIFLYDKYSKQIANSEFQYLVSLIDVIKNESASVSVNYANKSTSDQYNMFTFADIKEVSEFQYSFETPLSVLCKNSKRCLKIWTVEEDDEYVTIMRLPNIEHINTDSNINIPNKTETKLNFNKNVDISTPALLSKTILTSSLLKRKSSTPFSINPQQEVAVLKSLSNMQHLSATDSKVRVLTSALKNSESGSVTKSVKFNSSRYSRVICEDQFIDNEEKIPEPEAKKLFNEMDDDDLGNKPPVLNVNNENTEVDGESEPIENDLASEEMSVDQENQVDSETEVNGQEITNSDATPEKQTEERRLSTHVFQVGATTPPSQVKPLSFIMQASKELIKAEKEAEKAAALPGKEDRHARSAPKRSPMKKTLKFDVSDDDSIEFDKEEQNNSIGVASPAEEQKEEVKSNTFDSHDENTGLNNQNKNDSRESIGMADEVNEIPSAGLDQVDSNIPRIEVMDEVASYEEKSAGSEAEKSVEKSPMFQFCNPISIVNNELENTSGNSSVIERIGSEIQLEKPKVFDISNREQADTIRISPCSTEVERKEADIPEVCSSDKEVGMESASAGIEQSDQVTQTAEATTTANEPEVNEEASNEVEEQVDEMSEQTAETVSCYSVSEIVLKDPETQSIIIESTCNIEDQDDKASVSEDASSLINTITSSNLVISVSSNNDYSSGNVILIDSSSMTTDSHSKRNDDDTNNDITNTSFDLNMSSVSARDRSLTPKAEEESKMKVPTAKPDYLPLDSESQSVNFSMSRQDSCSSLFSHISSVSQQFDNDTPSKRRGRPPKKQMPRLIDDNELSIQKATEEAFDSKTSAKSRTIQRRKSDLSVLSNSSGSSAASTANIEAVARLRANMQKIPATFGSNEKEVRVTRSKLRSIIEPNTSDTDTNSQSSDSKPAARRVTRRVSKRVKELEQVMEEDVSSPKMSIKNLRRHNAAYEKMDIIADLMKKDEECGEEVELRASGGTTRATRVTRSMVTVSPTASSCVSESTLMSVASASVAKGTPKKVGRRPSKRLAMKVEEETSECNFDSTLQEITDTNSVVNNLSPSNSVISVSSSILSNRRPATRRPSKRVTKKVEEEKSEIESTIQEMSETTKGEDDISSPTNSVVSVASSTASSRYMTRNTEKKLNLSKAEDSARTLERKYNLRQKKGATAQMIEEIEKREQNMGTPTLSGTSTLTRKARVTRRTSKVSESTD